MQTEVFLAPFIFEPRRTRSCRDVSDVAHLRARTHRRCFCRHRRIAARYSRIPILPFPRSRRRGCRDLSTARRSSAKGPGERMKRARQPGKMWRNGGFSRWCRVQANRATLCCLRLFPSSFLLHRRLPTAPAFGRFMRVPAFLVNIGRIVNPLVAATLSSPSPSETANKRIRQSLSRLLRESEVLCAPWSVYSRREVREARSSAAYDGGNERAVGIASIGLSLLHEVKSKSRNEEIQAIESIYSRA